MLLYPTIFLTIILVLILWYDRRTMWTGFLASLWFIIFVAYITLFFEASGERAALAVMILLISIVILTMPLYLISFIWLLITSGIKLIRKEGRALHNFLSLGSGVLIVIWLTMSFYFEVDFTSDYKILMLVYFFLTTLVIYIVILLCAFIVSALLNKTFFLKKHYDYIIVLGSGLIGGKVPPLLASRIDKAIAIWEKQDDQNKPKLIFTGGKGHDEALAEGVAMAKYARAQDLPAKYILIEDKAVSTYENLLFSKKIIQSDTDKQHPIIVTVTNNFHVFRSLLWARKVGLKTTGVGSKTKFYFWLNALIREFIAILSMHKNAHLFVVICILMLSIAVFILNEYFVVY